MPIKVILVSGFRAALFGRFRCWLGEVLGVQLESTVDISCARYEYTGELCLFCHFSLGLFAICKLLSSVQMFFCVTMMNWRGGAQLSFCIWCPRGRALMGGPLIFTQQTVSIQVCVPVWCRKTEVLRYVFFMTSGNLQPQSIVKSLVPSLNTLVLFEVSPVSFHQVGRCWFLTAHEPRVQQTHVTHQ